MSGLSFDAAYLLLQSTMPDAQFYEVERHGDTDRYGLPTGEQVATVTCFEPRLTNAVRRIGGWTFFIDNRFISTTVHKIAAMWLIHEGGAKYGELELMRSLRYFFKRFYADSLVTLGTPPAGRALLIESVVFEKEFMNVLLSYTSDVSDPKVSDFNRRSFDIARHSILISQRHEIGHYLLSLPGASVLEHAVNILDGTATPYIEQLISEGSPLLAEEVFCDAFALNSIVRTEADYKAIEMGDAYPGLHLDEVRSANFCYTIMMQLSRIWFQATLDARANRDPADFLCYPEGDYHHSLYAQSNERASNVSWIVNNYIRKKGGDIYIGGVDFHYHRRFEQLIRSSASNLTNLSDSDELSIIDVQQREIARFLASSMWLSQSTSKFLVEVGYSRELDGWVRLDEEPMVSEEESLRQQTITDAIDEDNANSIAHSRFSMALEKIYDDYSKVFDAILSDISRVGIPDDGTIPRLRAFIEQIFTQIDELATNEEVHNNRLSRAYMNKKLADMRVKIQKKQVIVATMIRNTISTGNKIAFSESIAERLEYLEEYAQRNQGKNVAALTSILIPELSNAPKD